MAYDDRAMAAPDRGLTETTPNKAPKGPAPELADVLEEHDRLHEILKETVDRLENRLAPYLRPGSRPTREINEVDGASVVTQRLHISCQLLARNIDRLNEYIDRVG